MHKKRESANIKHYKKAIKILPKETKITIAYDSLPSLNRQKNEGYYYNNISNLYYSINGYNRIDPESAKFVLANRNLVELDYLFLNNNFSVKRIHLHNAINSEKPFIYEIPLKIYRLSAYNIAKSNEIVRNILYPELVTKINKGLCHLIFNTCIHSTNLDLFDTRQPLNNLIFSLKNIGLDLRKCTILSNGQNITKCNYINIIYWDQQETQIQEYLKNKQPINYVKKITEFSGKRFLCINKKQRSHRYYFVYQILKNKNSHNISFSLPKLSTESYLSSSCPFWNKLRSINHRYKFNQFLHKLPLVCEYKTPLTPYQQSIWMNEDIDIPMYFNTGIHLNTETRVGIDGEYIVSEKTYKDLATKMPFIICGPRFALKHIKTLGYKTFDNLWDESYDSIIDPIERVDAVVKLVNELLDLSNDDFLCLLKKAQSIVEHNYINFVNRKPLQYLNMLVNE